MTHRIKDLLMTACLVVGVPAIVFALIAGFGIAVTVGSDHGSPALAAEWADHLSSFDLPDAAVSADKRIWVIECENGEWLMGLAQGSHGVWREGGGTVVVRDSNGETRSFCGHVCSPNGSPFRGGAIRNLGTVYESVEQLGFVPLTREAKSAR